MDDGHALPEWRSGVSGVGATAVRFETGYLLSRELEDFVWSSPKLWMTSLRGYVTAY